MAAPFVNKHQIVRLECDESFYAVVPSSCLP